MCLEFIIALISIRLSNAVSISRHQSPALYPASTCTKCPRTESFKLSNRAIRAINDYLILIDNHEHLTRSCSSNDSMKLLHHYSYMIYSSCVFIELARAIKSRSVWSIFTLNCRLIANKMCSQKRKKSFRFIPYEDESFLWYAARFKHVWTCFRRNNFIAILKISQNIFEKNAWKQIDFIVIVDADSIDKKGLIWLSVFLWYVSLHSSKYA